MNSIGPAPALQGDAGKLRQRANEVFVSEQRAARWLETPNPKLGGSTPMQVFERSGAKRVEELLNAIGYGFVA